MPLPRCLPLRALARWPWRRVPHGAGARRLLPGLLLVPDGAAVLRRRDESLLDRRRRRLRAPGEATADGPLAWLRRRSRPDRRGCLPARDRVTGHLKTAIGRRSAWAVFAPA